MADIMDKHTRSRMMDAPHRKDTNLDKRITVPRVRVVHGIGFMQGYPHDGWH